MLERKPAAHDEAWPAKPQEALRRVGLGTLRPACSTSYAGTLKSKVAGLRSATRRGHSGACIRPDLRVLL